MAFNQVLLLEQTIIEYSTAFFYKKKKTEEMFQFSSTQDLNQF